ncbi:acetate--CoA ligase family protein [Pelagibacterium lacus]|nr:acetate--CoA ligase family protein [Pelagibacterium lacus]
MTAQQARGLHADNGSKDMSGLDALFRPRAVALIGASEDPRKIGGRPLRYMREAGSEIAIYPVNPTRETVQGYKAYPSVGAIPDQVDQAILAVPASLAEGAVAECLAAGVRSLVMFTAGFGEAGDEGKAAQDRLSAMVKAAGARLLGPNAMGLFNTADKVYSTFSTAMDRGTPAVGRVGMVSQSGAVGSYLQNLAISRGLKISKFVATGNEADVQAQECLEWMASDPDTDLLMLYLEGCRDGAGLIRALRTARENGKPVVVLKAGKTEAGQAVAASHTGALAGSGEVFDAVLREGGAYRAETLTEMVDVAYACSLGVLNPSNDLGIITVSGGVGVMATDAAVEANLDMPPISEAAFADIASKLPLAVGRNPLDTTAQTVGDRSIFTRSVDIMLGDRDYGSVMIFLANAGLNPKDMGLMREPLEEIRRAHPGTQLALCMQSRAEIRADFEDLGYLVFDDPVHCVKALAGAMRLAQTLNTPLPAPTENPAKRVAFATAPNEAEAKALLAEAGVAFAEERVAADAEAAVRAADAIGYPVVVKVLSADIAHKSEVGGVAVGLADGEAVRAAFERVTANARKAEPNAVLSGVTVAKMLQGGTQTIIGAHRDPTFGPVVMFGLGGIYTEVLKDTVLRLAPVTHETALQMIREIRTFPVLDGARGQEKADLDAIADTIVAVSRFIAAQGSEVESVEINPFIALPEGGAGVDALIVVS